jgi:hypothetical protein
MKKFHSKIRRLTLRLSGYLQSVHSGFLSFDIPVDKDSRKLFYLKNKHKGQSALIVGNGPSVRIENLENSSGMISFGMNQIFRIFEKTNWRPDYYAISDTLVAENFGDKILSLYNGTILASYHLKQILGSDKRILYFRKDHECYENTNPQFSDNCMKIVYGGYTTSYLCMQLAWFFGMKNMFTMGIDANYDFDDAEKVGMHGNYEVVLTKQKKNWFIPEYFDENEKMIKPKVKQQSLAYYAAKRFIEAKGGNITNVGQDSPLDIFPRKDFESIF